MKNAFILKSFLIFSILFFLISCNDDDSNTKKTNTIADFVIANQSDYSILLEALQKADGNLVTVLSGNTPYTVFAPNNTAFNTFLTANGFSSIDDVPTDVLSQILLNHVVNGSVESSSLTTGYIESLSTLTPNGANMNLYVDISNGVALNGVSNVTAADNIVDNGVVHLVDAVIGLPTVVTFAVADPTFDLLQAALTRSDLTVDFVTTLSTANGSDPAPFTIFAPTNDAFIELLAELEVESLDDIDEPTLKATLNHHAVAGANVISSSLTENMTINTLGGAITANINGGATLTDANDRVSTIIFTDVQASNGIIHVINKVILPNLATN